jgi:hypothetical protein
MRTCLNLSVALGLLMTAIAGSAADDQADINTLIGKGVKAMGGQEKVSKLQAASWKGNVTHRVGDKTFTMAHEASAQALNQYRVDAEMRAGGASRKILLVINGDKGWGQENGGKVDELPKDLPPLWKDGVYPMRVCQLLPGLKDKAFKMSPLGELKIGNQEAVGIQVTHKDHKDLSLFFDKGSGLPLKTETRLTLPGNKEITVEYHFSDYKEFEGINHFSKIAIKADGKEFLVELTEIRAQEKLDDSLFAKP